MADLFFFVRPTKKKWEEARISSGCRQTGAAVIKAVVVAVIVPEIMAEESGGVATVSAFVVAERRR